MTDRFPVLRLLPKTDARPVQRGFPWVYSNQAVLDRRTRNLPPGTIGVLEDGDRKALGRVAINPGSRIIGRMLDPDPQAVIDRDWIAKRIATACDLRTRLFADPYWRLAHAESDGLPGVIIDRFGESAVVQPNAAWAEGLIEPIVASLLEVPGVVNVIKNTQGRARALEGLPDDGNVLAGSVAGPVSVPMNGAIYRADLLSGQKTGLFFDQRPNHAFAARLAGGGTVLDVFSHVGGFALSALAGGASSALAVDSSAPALALAEEGAAESGFGDRFSTLRGDAFDVLAALRLEGRRFDMVVCDPPAFAPSKSALDAGLRAYEKVARMAATLVSDGGFLVLCSCSHAADLPRFRSASVRGLQRAGATAQLLHTGSAGPDHPQHPALAESGYLKALFFRVFH